MILIAIILCLSVFLEAQNRSSSYSPFHKRRLCFSISPVLYDNLNIDHQGKEILKSKCCYSGESIISYYQPIKNGYGIIIGAGIGLTPININYDFSAEFNNPDIKGIQEYLRKDNDYDGFFWLFPLSLHKTLFDNNGRAFSVELGVKFNQFNWFYEKDLQSYYGSRNDTTTIPIFDYDIDKIKNKNFISYFMKIGLMKAMKNNNVFNINLFANYSPETWSGSYRFYNFDFDSYGTIKKNNNFIGLEFTFGMSSFKRNNNKQPKKVFENRKDVRLNIGFSGNKNLEFLNTTDGDVLGAGLSLMPKWSYSKKIAFCLNIELSFVNKTYHGSSSGYFDKFITTSIVPTVFYYPFYSTIKPFLGLGIGKYSVYTFNYDAQAYFSNDPKINIGVKPLVGISFDNVFDLSVEFNKLLFDVDTSPLNNFDNYYLAIKGSVSIGIYRTEK